MRFLISVKREVKRKQGRKENYRKPTDKHKQIIQYINRKNKQRSEDRILHTRHLYFIVPPINPLPEPHVHPQQTDARYFLCINEL